MTAQSDEALETLRGVWSGNGQTGADIDEECLGGANNKLCRNAVHMNFDGYVEEGEDADVASAWHTRLEREGKLSKHGSLADLILSEDERLAAVAEYRPSGFADPSAPAQGR
jgi:hypothetical protein